uniref:Transposase (putative) gypsy type domain-containing protein n=1 Tax=Silene latifolia TaxID=37657 RepID=Q3I6J2_SILLA|nr:unknown [Silene latifolia]
MSSADAGPNTSAPGGSPSRPDEEEALVVTPLTVGGPRPPSPEIDPKFLEDFEDDDDDVDDDGDDDDDDEERTHSDEERPRLLDHGDACSINPDRAWTNKFASCSGSDLFEDHYSFGRGYKIVIPKEGQAVCCPPKGCIGVYIRHLEYGLRFPLNAYVVAIIKAMNVAVAQLHPLAIRTIIGFVWLCLFKGEAPTVNLFRRLHHLRPSTLGGTGWYSVQTEPGYVTVSKISSCKDWKRRWVYVEVPEDYPLPRSFQSRVNLRCESKGEHDKYVSWSKLKMDASRVYLNEDEKRAMQLFEAEKDGTPKGWMPPMQIILQDELLCHVGLIPALRQGEWGRCEAHLCFLCFCILALVYLLLFNFCFVPFTDRFGPDLSADILKRLGLGEDGKVVDLHPKALPRDRRPAPNELMDQQLKALDATAAQARIAGNVPRRKPKTTPTAATTSTPIQSAIPVVQKEQVVVVVDVEEEVTVAEGPPPSNKRKETVSAAAAVTEAGKEKGPPTKKAKAGTDLTCGSDLAGSLGIPDDRLSDMSMNVDMDALSEFFIDQPTPACRSH